MPKQSAGLIMYRRQGHEVEVLLVHPGGPFWAKKDKGVWSIPKGALDSGEAPLDAAIREFNEETGFTAQPPFIELGIVQQASGKLVSAWAFAGDCDPDLLVSNRCHVEWPPRSGREIEICEVDRACWFTMSKAASYLLKGQQPLLQRLAVALQARAQSVVDEARS